MSKKEELYRPGSGTEGEIFMDQFCDQCKHDQDFHNPCQIILRTMIFDLNDPEYPKQWILSKTGPKCTSFEQKQETKQ